MLIKTGPSIHQNSLSASLEQHAVWRYVITDRNSGEVISDGFAGDLEEARRRAEAQLEILCEARQRAA